MQPKLKKLLVLASLLVTSSLQAQEAGPLPGTWMIQAIKGKVILADSNPTLQFNKNGQLAATAGCNNMSSGYELDEKNLNIGMVMATRKMCSESLMEQETRLMQVLGADIQYSIDGTTLVPSNANGDKLLSAVKAMDTD